MKFSALISVLFLCFVFVACASEDDESCVTVLDCPDGYSCVNSVCQPPTAVTDADPQEEDGKPQDSSDTSEPDDSSVLPGNDDSLPGAGDGDNEIPDDVINCPNLCSGFGDCDFTTGKCTCTDNHGGEDCSGCAEGYHLEAEGDDEDGNPDIRSCVVNVTCNPNPCNNNGCSPNGDTVICTCNPANHQGGRWCQDCAEGYLLNNDGVCKEDCTLKTCTPPQKCGIDYATNEASCNNCENEYYTGTDCKSCDAAHFCNGHATACVVEGGTEKCTCEPAYTGSTCNTCASGYFQSNGVCIKSCDTNTCFKSLACSGSWGGMTASGYATAHGTCNNTTGGCDCDAGWLTGTSTSGIGSDVDCDFMGMSIGTLHNIECALCDKDNPPSEYTTSGCPTKCPTMFCNDMIFMVDTSVGGCYYEPTGSHRLYCKCNSGYTMSGTGSVYYDSNSSGMCTSESSE